MTNLVLGGVLACAAVVFTGLPAAAWNAGIVGLLIVYCSFMALYRYAPWQEWSNATLGCWALAAPFMFGFGSEPVPTWTHVLIGLCVATIAIVQLVAGRASQGDVSARS
jgi:hypothetical protein